MVQRSHGTRDVPSIRALSVTNCSTVRGPAARPSRTATMPDDSAACHGIEGCGGRCCTDVGEVQRLAAPVSGVHLHRVS